ncbi:MAG: tetratricopeptide repeat protein [Desulfobacterales bacterium]|nr:MAG: tetratricopeptide repeat protein [Desulfobacterales bacterium]
MIEERAKRKLSAVLSADVKGYSRLMGEDESGTVRTLKEYRGIMAKLIQRYRGRVVDSPGDNLLAEFGSVVDAVEGAVEIQKQLKLRNDELPEARRMEFRIGVNLGDIVEDGERIYGDGVNIAARLESLADGGCICISGTCYDQIGKKLPFGYEYLGEKSVKNIEKPVPAYRVLIEPEAAGKVIGEKRFLGRISRRSAMAAIIILIVVAGGLASWNFFLHQSKRLEPASLERMAFPLPAKPSLAVLPFVNMSENPRQEYFSDGITEDLITDLSKISGLFVIARNSVFAYKSEPVQIRQIAEELGVRYVLEGSVRRSGDQVRINAQLIDATTGGHLWAERYDGKMDNVFALQDRITHRIISALKVKLTADEEKQVAGVETNSTEAYEAFLQGWAHYWQDTREDIVQAIPYMEKAVKIDPNYSRAYAALAASYWRCSLLDWSSSLGLTSSETLEKAKQYLQQAMKEPTPLAHLVASSIRSAEGRYQESIVEATRAILLDANDPVGYIALGKALIYAGKPGEGADAITKAMRLNPHYPPTYLRALGFAQFGMEHFEEAAASYEEAIKRDPNEDTQYFEIAGIYGQLGREVEAKSALKTFNELRARAGMSDPYTLQTIGVWGFKEQEDVERWREGLRRAGVPPGREPVAPAEDLIYQTEQGPEVKGATTIDVATAKALFDRGVPFVDVRRASQWAKGHIPGAVNLEFYGVFSKIELSKIARKEDEVVIHCSDYT